MKNVVESKNSVFFLYGSCPFSNFYSVSYKLYNKTFTCSEQGYMWEKAMFFKDYEIASKILLESDPKVIKLLGRQVRNYDEKAWNDVRIKIMMRHLYAKFSQNDRIKQVLLSTANKDIVEASSKDTVWGIGVHINETFLIETYEANEHIGKNYLGRCLMHIRKLLRE